MQRTNRRALGIMIGAALIGVGGNASAWWDTVVATERPVPLMREIEAETCSGPAKADIVQDAQSDGGRGGQAVLLRPGGTGLSTELELKPGIYALFAIARDAKGEPDKLGLFTPKMGNGLMTLEVKEHKTGETRSWTMVVVYREQYFAVGQMYFPAYAGGKYTATIKLPTGMDPLPTYDPPTMRRFFDAKTGAFTKPLVPLLVDRLELRDALSDTARQAAKTKRMLTSDEELAARRAEARPGSNERYHEPYAITDGQPLEPAAREARNEKLWNLVPGFNAHVSSDYENPYSFVLGRDRTGMIALLGDAYERTGNPEFAWDGAVLICSVAEKWPAVDFLAQGTEGGAGVNLQMGFPMNALTGKQLYRGWADTGMSRLATVYDQLFDFIKGNQELAKFVGARISWVKSPEDVIKLLDVNLLQSGMDYCKRNYIQHDEPKVLIPLVQGVNPVSDRMLDSGIFTKTGLNMALRGGIDDQAFTTLSRDGLHYMGAVSYFSDEFNSVVELLHRYCLAGGAPRFDVAAGGRCPQLAEGNESIAKAHAAGGFMLNFGDGPTMLMTRRAGYEKEWPSRLMAGVGISVLESGSTDKNLLHKRAVGLYFGLGRGHAHQDTLTFEMFAHGARVVPDTGGRHEGGRGSPNMRWNKVHNMVEVDERNFENPYPGSTTSASGWNTGFSPFPGAQYMEHYARATSHPYVSRYGRQTAMIDVGDDSYIFDVFRVRGGKVHTYCFHGCQTEKLALADALKPASSEEAVAYLAAHKEGTRMEGVAPEVLQADWVMTERAQKTYQSRDYQADRVPTTRFVLFGHRGEKLMLGNELSNAFDVDYPYLYVQGRQADGDRESVYPAIIEPFAGKPFLAGKRQVGIAPAQSGADSAAALEVKTVGGRADLLYASGKPGELATLDNGVQVSGKFAFLSRDDRGVRCVELVAGTDLSAEDVTIKTERAAYVGKVGSVRYDAREFTVDGALPARLLRGQIARLGADVPPEKAGRVMQHAFDIREIEPSGKGAIVRHEKTARCYQSAIVKLDDEAGTIETEIEPVLFGCDTDFFSDATIANERQDKFWKAALHEGDRWMNIGHPGYRGSFPNTCSMSDFPDVNKDGRHTVRLIGVGGEGRDGALAGKTLMEMEITRVTPDGETIYFKMPAIDSLPENPSESFQRGGWAYVDRVMVNEDGSRKWSANYPGSSFLWKPAGGFKASDFGDADGDGKAKMAAYLFGPGDVMTIDTAVAVTRGDAPGSYEVSSNVPLTLGLPRGGFAKAGISADGKTFAPIAAKVDGARLVLALGERELGDGKVFVRLSN